MNEVIDETLNIFIGILPSFIFQLFVSSFYVAGWLILFFLYVSMKSTIAKLQILLVELESYWMISLKHTSLYMLFQVLERRYGGRIRAHTAATRIQRAFRQYRLLQQWRNLILPLRNNRSQFNFQCDRLRKPIGLRDYRSCGLLRNAIEPYRNLERNCISTSSVNPNRAYRTLTRHNDHHLYV